MIRPILVVVAFLALPLTTPTVYAFQALVSPESVTYRTRLLPGAQNFHPRSPMASLNKQSACGVTVKMSSENDSPSNDSNAVVAADGTFYDDEVS
jgi:hypothetical protein